MRLFYDKDLKLQEAHPYQYSYSGEKIQLERKRELCEKIPPVLCQQNHSFWIMEVEGL